MNITGHDVTMSCRASLICVLTLLRLTGLEGALRKRRRRSTKRQDRLQMTREAVRRIDITRYARHAAGYAVPKAKMSRAVQLA